MRKTYTVKEIAEYTGLSEAKIRSFIKSGSLKGESVKAISSGRTVTRLEVAEEDLAAFALANHELVGPLMGMDFMRKYSINEVENGDPTGDAVEAENGDPTNNANEEDTDVHPDGNWEDPAEADFNSDGDADTAEQQPNEEMDATDANLSNSPSENNADKKEKMLLELRELKNVFEENLATFEGQLASANEAVRTATHAINWTRGMIDNLDMVINHISENM